MGRLAYGGYVSAKQQKAESWSAQTNGTSENTLDKNNNSHLRLKAAFLSQTKSVPSNTEAHKEDEMDSAPFLYIKLP